MKLQLVSDLHLEFAPISLPKTDADVLLLSGDIVPIAYLGIDKTDAESRKIQKRVESFTESLGRYSKVFHIMGNHEFYKGVWEDTVDKFLAYWQEKAPNVTVLNDEAIPLEDGLMLFGGTLWTDFAGGDLVHMQDAQDGMNDYHLISCEPSVYTPYGLRHCRLNPLKTYEAHENTRYALKEAIERSPELSNWIVMTHHLPSWKSVAECHSGSPLNWAYASDLDQFIIDHPQIRVWTHGHTHTSWDYTIGDTGILCNPRGYAHPNRPNKSENSGFNPAFTFEV